MKNRWFTINPKLVVLNLIQGFELLNEVLRKLYIYTKYKTF